MRHIEIGDIVELDIDGPEMLVTGFLANQPQLAFCEWFNEVGEGNWQGCKQVFHVNLLRRINKDRS